MAPAPLGPSSGVRSRATTSRLYLLSLSLSPITHAPRPFVPQPHNTPRTCMRPAQAPPRAASHSGCRRALAHSSELRFRTCGPPTGKTRKEPSCSAASAVPYGRAHRDDMIKLTSAAILTHAEVNTYHLLTYYYLLTHARRGATEVLQRACSLWAWRAGACLFGRLAVMIESIITSEVELRPERKSG